MDISPLLMIAGLGALIFALLLVAGRRRGGNDTSLTANKARDVAVAGLSAINLTGAIAMGWFAATILFYDGLMVVELAICAFAIAVLALATWGAFSLKHRGKTGTAIALLAFTAVPTIAVYAFLLYLDSHPIDMR